MEEYLKDVLEAIPEDHHRRFVERVNLNFAEAALVLQSSTNVYSRKVDYLTSLVYKAYEEICSGLNTVGRQVKTRNKSGQSAAIEEFLNFDPNDEFLLLDDVLPIDQDQSKINLPPDGLAEDESISDNTHSRLSLGVSSSKTRLSHLGALGSASRRSTLHNTTSGVSERSITNQQAHRELAGMLDTATLQLMSDTTVSEQYGLLVPSQAGTAQSSRLSTWLGRRSSAGRSSFAGLGETPRNIVPDPAIESNDDQSMAAGNDYDHDNDGAGFVMADDGSTAPADYENPGATSHERKRVKFSEQTLSSDKLAEDDPWEMLDPHVPDGVKPKPLRVNKTIKLPPGIANFPGDCVTGARTRRLGLRRAPIQNSTPTYRPPRSLAANVFKALVAAARINQCNRRSMFDEVEDQDVAMPNVSLKELAYGQEFAYIAKAFSKRRAAERRAMNKQQAVEEGETAAFATYRESDYGENDDFIFGGGGDFHDDDNDDGAGDNIGGEALFPESNDDGPYSGNAGIDSLDEAYEGSDKGETIKSVYSLRPTRNFNKLFSYMQVVFFMARPLKTFVVRILKLSLKEPRNTLLKAIFRSVSVTGKPS